MTNRAILACLAMAAILAGCGGGTATPASPPAAPSAVASTEPVASSAASPAGSAAAGPAAEDLAVAAIETVPTPCEVAEGLGRVWISSYAQNEVVGIDPATNETVSTLAVPDGPCGVTVGFDSVWVSGGTQTVARIDPESGETLATIHVPARSMTSRQGRTRCGPRTGRTARSSRSTPKPTRSRPPTSWGPSADGFRIADDAIWVAADRTGEVFRVDPEDGSVVATIKVGTRPNWIALGEDAVWVENTGDGTVMKIDPATNEVVGTFDVGRAPVYMAVVDGRLWVANGGERSVSVLDEATGDDVTRIGFETGVHGRGCGRRLRVGPRPPWPGRPGRPEGHDDLAVRPGNGYSVGGLTLRGGGRTLPSRVADRPSISLESLLRDSAIDAELGALASILVEARVPVIVAGDIDPSILRACSTPSSGHSRMTSAGSSSPDRPRTSPGCPRPRPSAGGATGRRRGGRPSSRSRPRAR